VVKLASTPTARNLIRIFFLTERLKGLGGGIPASATCTWSAPA
jgi:hypothetical protein